MNEVGSFGWNQLTPWAIVAIFVISTLLGRLVPRRQVEDWKELYEHEVISHEKTRDALRASSTSQNASVEAAKTAVALVQAAQTAGIERTAGPS